MIIIDIDDNRYNVEIFHLVSNWRVIFSVYGSDRWIEIDRECFTDSEWDRIWND